MQFLINWWSELIFIQKIFSIIAVSVTVILIIQTILLIFQKGKNVNVKKSGKGIKIWGIKFFTFKGFISYFSVSGWLAVLFLGFKQISVPVAIILAMTGGIISQIIIVLTIKLSEFLQEK